MKSLRVLLVVAGGLAFFAGALAVLAGAGRRADIPRGSVFNESPQGVSLARRYLGAGLLTRRASRLRLPKDAVLFRIRPRPRPEALLTPAEEDWVRGGGRLVLGVDAGYGPLTVKPSPSGPVHKVFPIWPGVEKLVLPEGTRALGGPPAEEGHAVFTRGASPLLSRLTLDKGEVLLLAVPELLENAHLGRGDHLRLLVALAGEGRRPVLFDEWAQGHGSDEGLLDLMLDWGFGPALLAAAFALTLWLWRERSRLGPEEPGPPETRTEAVDLVDSLAQLYDRALTRREAARLYREGFHKALGLRSGLKGAALAARARELLGRGVAPTIGEGEIAPSEFLKVLRTVNQGYRRLHEHAHSSRSL